MSSDWHVFPSFRHSVWPFPSFTYLPPWWLHSISITAYFSLFFFSRRPLDTLRHTHALAHTLPTIPPTLATFYEPTFLTSLRPSQNYGSVLHCGTSAALIIRWLVTCIDPGVVLFLFLAPLPFYLLFVSSSPSSFFFSPRWKNEQPLAILNTEKLQDKLIPLTVLLHTFQLENNALMFIRSI